MSKLTLKKSKHVITQSPQMVNWNYSYKCNLNCKHCYSRTRNEKEATIEEKYKIADNIIKNDVFWVNLGGGEPIILNETVEMIKYLTDNDIYVSLSSNGTFIKEKKAYELYKANLSGGSISLDHSIREEHNRIRGFNSSYDDAITAMKLLISFGIDVIISTTMTSENYEVLEDIIKIGVDLGCRGISLKRLKMAGNALINPELELKPEQVAILYKNIFLWKEKYNEFDIILNYGTDLIKNLDGGCPCGRTAVAITSNGTILPCVYNESIPLGNAIHDDLSELWNNEKLTNLRNNFKCLGRMLAKETD
ncbi:radical SAM protein [Enterococcus sp. CWB-B31]|uniref:radical SAM protein n=1 Tax=Enterococcus sp. CWB-B31 TaxID=2885159 RepID=UPI001E58B31E|nr:radical SAM protein [Enterococcus sp. CWB-B31]MCB5954400.1 radical SAM protein [Enterococcus sp. CWB-B31]